MILIALILDSLFAPCVSTRHLVIKNPLSQLAFPCERSKTTSANIERHEY